MLNQNYQTIVNLKMIIRIYFNQISGFDAKISVITLKISNKNL
jgi:hypothetical protein